MSQNIMMNLRRLPGLFLLCLLGMSPACMNCARAALGGDVASVAADTADLGGEDRVTTLQTSDIHEFRTTSGVHVREFLNRNGVVFALSWSGPVIPDLHILLGVSFPAYSSALAAVQQRGLRRFIRISTPGLVVENGGHMRALSGRAYLPAMLPPGTSPADIR